MKEENSTQPSCVERQVKLVYDYEEMLEEFQERIGYCFKDIEKLKKALTHSSFANELGLEDIRDNERLEFLGDAILDMIISDHLYRKFRDDDEGVLTQKRSSLVSKDAMLEKATELNMPMYLRLGRGEEKTGGRVKKKIVADALEALIASVYLDGGYMKVKKFILNLYKEELKFATVKREQLLDELSLLQEMSQRKLSCIPKYKILQEDGPCHSKHFVVKVSLNRRMYGIGEGRTKKDAKKDAARNAIKKLQEENLIKPGDIERKHSKKSSNHKHSVSQAPKETTSQKTA